MLNERVSTLSAAVKGLTESTGHSIAPERREVLLHYEKKEERLGAVMKREFAYKQSLLNELFNKWRVPSNLPNVAPPGQEETHTKRSADEIRGVEIKPEVRRAFEQAHKLRKGFPGRRAASSQKATHGQSHGKED